MVPTLSVSLRPCDCRLAHRQAALRARGAEQVVTHLDDCACSPILIPCPIPRSVTFEVRLGECACWKVQVWANGRPPCLPGCPARPVKVSCSISGETWAESEVFDIDPLPELWGANANLRAIARERWALVRALVLGQWPTASSIGVLSEAIPGLVAQRDVAFNALADMARAEHALAASVKKGADAIGSRAFPPPVAVCYAESALAAYVERLIEQVRVLP